MTSNICCICCDVKSGVIATGVYHSIQSIIGCIICALLAIDFGTGAIRVFLNPNGEDAAVCIYFLVLSIAFNIELVASVCLIIGVLQYKRELITAWIATNFFLLLGYAIMWIISFPITSYAGFNILSGILGAVGIAILIYSIAVVWCYRKAVDKLSSEATSDPPARYPEIRRQERAPQVQQPRQWQVAEEAQTPPEYNPQWIRQQQQQQTSHAQQWQVFKHQQQNFHP